MPLIVQPKLTHVRVSFSDTKENVCVCVCVCVCEREREREGGGRGAVAL